MLQRRKLSALKRCRDERLEAIGSPVEPASPEQKIRHIRAIKRELFSRAEDCGLCPRRCGVNRLAGERGYCRAPGEIMAASHCLHRGEEPPISGRNGSGTIFFSHCNLRCIFCQNYQISHLGMGRRYTPSDLAAQMLELQNQGAHNINLVSPTPYTPWIMEALEIALEGGLSLPLVYNTHGYESVDTLKLLNRIIDVYLPDLKYARPTSAARFSGASDYPVVAREAIKIMASQTGLLQTDEEGIAIYGVLVRHLVLPGYTEDSLEIVDFLAALDKSIPVALMSQYYPCYRAAEYPPLNRRLQSEEYESVVRHALNLGMEEVLVQELDSAENYRPDFEREHPFE
jgi:putative pyruvate formate lyase activating enzyme